MYTNEQRSLGYILDRLQESADTIARLVVANSVQDTEALLVMDRALATLEANGRANDF